MKTNASKTELIFPQICCREDLKEWQWNSDLGVGSFKITADHNLTSQRENISQNMPENFDSDL